MVVVVMPRTRDLGSGTAQRWDTLVNAALVAIGGGWLIAPDRVGIVGIRGVFGTVLLVG